MRSMWMRPGPTPGSTTPAFGQAGNLAARAVGLAALGGVFLLLWATGYAYWSAFV